MRKYLSICLAIFFASTAAFADDMEFKRKIAQFVRERFSAAGSLQSPTGEIWITFAIDHDGKLLSADIDRSSGSKAADEQTITRLRAMQPFPRVPDELQVPYKIPATFVLSPLLQINVELKPSKSADSSNKTAFQNAVLRHLRDHLLTLPRPGDQMPAHPNHAIFSLTLDGSGKVQKVVTIKSFGLKTFDEQVPVWLKHVEPFPDIPQKVTAPVDVMIEAWFDAFPSVDDKKAKRAIGGICRGC